jgi:hypothetical protein
MRVFALGLKSQPAAIRCAVLIPKSPKALGEIAPARLGGIRGRQSAIVDYISNTKTEWEGPST